MNVVSIILILFAAKMGINSINQFIIRPNKLKMELKKYSNTDMIKVIDLPDELYEGNDLDVKENVVYQKVYSTFCKFIEDKIHREDLDNYYRNFKTLKEYNESTGYIFNHLRRGYISGGTYNSKENTIDLATTPISELYNSICHELLHASSTRLDLKNDVIYSGLSQVQINKKDESKALVHGIGINEGLTQYYANKFFDPRCQLIPAYSVYEEEQAIARLLEIIIGKEKLQSLYFRADLNGLINELLKYASKEDIYKFIKYTDVLFYYSSEKQLKFRELDEVKNYINTFLINAYNNSVKAKSVDLTKVNGLSNDYLPYRRI